MRIPVRHTLACALLGLALVPGCIAVGGTENSQAPTLGKQLIDLKTARDTGAISQPEYDSAKTKLLAQQK